MKAVHALKSLFFHTVTIPNKARQNEYQKALHALKKHALKNCPGENSGAALFMYRVGRSSMGKNYSAIFLNSS